MKKRKYDHDMEYNCPECGNVFRIYFDAKPSDLQYCPFCGEDIVEEEDIKIDVDYEEEDFIDIEEIEDEY